MSSGETREPIYLQANAKENLQSYQGLGVLDQRFELIRHNNLPSTPYLLAIHSRRQYHLSEYQQREELKEKETGFKPEERHLQYLTFLSKGWEGTILSAIRPEQQVNGITKPKAMASTNAGPKGATKKISIDDYKKRSSLPARSLNGSPAIDEVRSRAASSSLANKNSSAGVKRSSDVLEKSKLHATTDAPLAKKLKPSPHLGPSSSRTPQVKSKLILPPPLSPTLPAFVERLLSKADDIIPKAESPKPIPAVGKKTKPLNLPNHGKTLSQESPASRKSNPSSTIKTSNPQNSKSTPNGTYGSPSISQHRLNHSSISEIDTNKILSTSRAKSPTPSVIVRLRIPKDRRLEVSKSLNLPPRNTQVRKSMSKANSSQQENRPSMAGKSAEKRPREDDNLNIQHEGGRPKSPAYQEQPAGKKIRESTPLTREEVTTPQGTAAVGTPIPPTSASRGSRDRQTQNEAGGPSSHMGERMEELVKLKHKYSNLGVTWKKESDKLFTPDMSPAQLKKLIASRIEVTLTFMLSYTISDEVSRLKRRAPTPESTWNSLFTWIASVHKLLNDHPYVSGLLLQLEAISTMVVWRQRSEIAEQGDSISVEKSRELRLQCEDAHKKFVKGSAKLSVDDLQNEFPRTWKTKDSLPLAHHGYRMTKDNLDGKFYLPLTSTSLPIEGVRAGKAFLAEWCKREGVEWTAKLDF